jgi:hypothetical protein
MTETVAFASSRARAKVLYCQLSLANKLVESVWCLPYKVVVGVRANVP